MFAQGQLDIAKSLVASARSVVVLTGAGISTAAGIPDFRGPDGLWTRDPKAALVSNLDDYRSDAGVRALAWQRRAAVDAGAAVPTPAHRALVDFEACGKLRGILTQNTDGLHLAAGSDPRLVLELHGNVRRWRCDDCGASGPMTEMLERVRAGDADPRCPTCGGITRATVILFGESLDTALLERAWQLVTDSDLLLVLGSTLVVQPVAGLVRLATMQPATQLIICNRGETPFDASAAAVLDADVQEVVPELLAAD